MNVETFEKRWLQAFAADVSGEDIEKYVVATGNYIWHVFSWKLLPEACYLSGDAARNAFDQADKSGAICIKPFGKKGSGELPKEYMSASSLETLTEVYVVAKDYRWTYIKTHEGDFCGPYFMELPDKATD